MAEGLRTTRLPGRDPVREVQRIADAADWLCEVAEDFLRAEYPVGTTHPADSEVGRLARAVATFKDVRRV